MKKFTLSLAALALIGVSCSNDITESVAPATADNVIGFMSSTTRADVSTITTIQNDEAGIVIYGTNGDGATDWYTDTDGAKINGLNNYAYTNNAWGWVNSKVLWPDEEEDTNYPMNFYAYYAPDYTSVTDVTDDGAELSMNYTAAATNQVDLLTAVSTTDVRPSGDKLPLVFNHALTKIAFNITPGTGVSAYIQATGINGVSNKCALAITDGTDDGGNPIKMWKATEEEDNTLGSYSFLDTNTAENATSDALTGTNGDLMLIPQTSVNWVPDPTEAEGVKPEDLGAEDGYIYLFYRLTDSTNPDLVGYTDASDHPMYNEDDYGYLDGTPLFVKVGYPLSGDVNFTWEAGKAYTYDLNLGTDDASNGYLLDSRYYDENGNPTDLFVEHTDPYEKLNDGCIDFTVTVNKWDTTNGDMTIK